MDADDDAQAMAQFMGFSSFGQQDPPAKKRRYNPKTDSSIPSSASTSDQKPSAKHASGANSAALGTRAINSEEISLEDEEDAQPQEQVIPQQHGTAAEPAGLSTLPARPAFATGHQQHGKPSGRHESHARGHNPLWYQGYYDPSSNHNPWEKLEEKLQLIPKGTWLARGDAPVR